MLEDSAQSAETTPMPSQHLVHELDGGKQTVASALLELRACRLDQREAQGWGHTGKASVPSWAPEGLPGGERTLGSVR